ncbi:MAG: hypothetical protein K8S16_12135 [Bacteroidales bacterium]|nr:hypothetical protein [Bacteroidales bacterium]
MWRFILVFTTILAIVSVNVFGTILNGDLHSWDKKHLTGFDPVGDCSGPTGDISSVFSRMENDKLVLRVTFDDMVNRSENVVESDNFISQDISITIKIDNKSTRTTIFSKTLLISNIANTDGNIEYLRTPENNLLEIALEKSGFKLQEVTLSVLIYIDGKMVDEFLGDGKGSKATGNCAFVNHGNQGLTYTEVFYGSPGGISGLDGSGFDEVLQAHEATGTPGNFHMSGTLMPAAE